MLNLFPTGKANTWRSFALRVATIAIAALIVLGAMQLLESRHPSARPGGSYDRESSRPLPESTP